MIQTKVKMSKKLKDWENILSERLEILEKIIDSNTKSDSLEYFNYIKTKGEWEKWVKERTNGITLWSESWWIEEGKKTHKILHKPREEKSRQKIYKKLITDNGNK